MMPFAGYPNYDACTSDNKDKADPSAFCAWLEHKTTGKWPGEMTQGLPKDVKDKFLATFETSMTEHSDEIAAMKSALKDAEALGWLKKKQGWMRRSDNKIATRSVFGVPIFAVGTHNGDPYTNKDLEDMVAAFTALKGRVNAPLKVGHTTDEFNKNLAKKMGIAPEFISGEDGNGAMAFGWIEDMRKQGNRLFADLSDVPEPIAEMIETKSYSPVSCEVMFGLQDRGTVYPKVVTGLALLGAEQPAVKGAGLETAAVYVRTFKADAEIEYAETEDPPADSLPKKDEKPGDKQKLKEEETMEKEVFAELGVAENASKEEVMSVIRELKEAATFKQVRAALGLDDKATLEDVKAAVKNLQAQLSAGDKAAIAKFADMESKVAKLSDSLAAEKRKNRVREYTATFTELKAISGKPEELAEALVSLEEKDEASAVTMLEHYKATNDQLLAAGIFQHKGTPLEDQAKDHEFIKATRKYSEDNRVSMDDAMIAVKGTNPELWQSYRLANREALVVGDEGDE